MANILTLPHLWQPLMAFLKQRSMAVVVLCSFGISSYAGTPTDTLQLAKDLRNKQHYAKACKVLAAYNKTHAKDVNSLWLQAQTEYWRGNVAKSAKLYRKAAALKTGSDYFLIDYAKTLADMGELKDAEDLANKLDRQGKNYSEVKYVRAKIAYMQGDYITARQWTDKCLYQDGINQGALQLSYDILRAKSPWVQINAAYMRDNQPLQSITPWVTGGIFLHQYAALRLGIYAPVFINSTVTSSQAIQIGDRSYFYKGGTELQVDMGAVKLPNNKIDWTGNLDVTQIFIKHLVIDLQAEHKAYLYTLSSLDTNVTYYHFAPSIGWNDKSFIQGKVGFDMALFPDKNYVYSAYTWVFAPPIRVPLTEIRLGYGYSYSDSKQSQYQSTRTVQQIVTDFASNPNVTGVYNPYFTPHQQSINSLLLSVNLQPVKALQIGISGSVGFYATTQAPYLFLNTGNGGNLFIDNGYAKTSYVPFDAGAWLLWQVSHKVELKAQYNYRSTYFFNSNYAALSCKISFWHGK